MAGQRRFLAALFEFSFTELVTERVAGTVYGVAVGAIGILAGAVVAFGFAQHPALALLFVTGAAAGFLASVLVVRVWLEAVVVLVRIAEQAEELAEQVAGIAMELRRTEQSHPAEVMRSQPS